MVQRKPGQLLPLEFRILDAGMSLQADDGSFYGFLLAKTLSHADDSSLLSHGTLYKALGRLTKSGLLDATWEDPELAEEAGRPRRRLYTVTGEGELARSREHHRLEQLMKANPAAAFGPVTA